MKKKLLFSTLMGVSVLLGGMEIVHADSAPGDVIIVLGKNLTEAQQVAMMGQFGSDESTQVIEVTNQEEHQYLGEYLPKTKIGTKALSSAKITIGNDGEGLKVTTDKINWVTGDMYINALSTAGVTDAKVEVTAPVSVSGTAALTGILKAYESTMGEKIPEEQKQVANEELVKTAQLGDSIGTQKATEIMSLVKASIAENKPATDKEMEEIITNAATQQGVEMSPEETQGLVELFNKMQNANIDFAAVGENLTVAKDKVIEFLNQEDTKNFIEKMGDFFASMVEAIKGWFS